MLVCINQLEREKDEDRTRELVKDQVHILRTVAFISPVCL